MALSPYFWSKASSLSFIFSFILFFLIFPKFNSSEFGAGGWFILSLFFLSGFVSYPFAWISVGFFFKKKFKLI